MEIDTGTTQLSDLPAAFLRNIAGALWGNARDLAHLAATCRTLQSICSDPIIWKDACLRRFGPAMVPGRRPASDELRHADVEGWVFYQGKDGSDDGDVQHAGADLQQLLALADSAGAEAFTTTGKVINDLQKPQGSWKHFSFIPKQGMYVKRSVVETMQFTEPEAAAAGSDWPPEIPGWVYFPSCVSEDFSNSHVPHGDSLLELLRRCEQNTNMLAVTTQGEAKCRLRPQRCWKIHRDYDVGLYVKLQVVNQLQLTLPPAEPDYRALYAKLDSLRVDAAQMSVTWLDGRYLDLVPDTGGLTDSGVLLHLDNVWWLDMRGSIPGVPPGSYEVYWVVNATNTYWERNCEINISAEAQPNLTGLDSSGTAQPHTNSTSSERHGTTSNDTSNEEQGASSTATSVSVKYGFNDIQQLRQRCTDQNSMWGVISGGVLQVEDYSTVAVRFWSTDNTLKRKMQWAYVELKPSSHQGRSVRALQEAGSRGRQLTGHQQQYAGYMGAHGHQQQYGMVPELGPLGGMAQWLLGVLGRMWGPDHDQAHQASDGEENN